MRSGWGRLPLVQNGWRSLLTARGRRGINKGMPLTRFAFRWWTASVALVAALSGPAAQAASGEKWLKVSAPEFTVITTLGEKDAVAWTNEFSQFVGTLQGFIRVNPKFLPRLTLVVFAKEKDFQRFQPLRENGTAMETAGFFARRPSWAVAGMGGLRMNDETRTTIFHEGTHWFTSAFELPNPVWLEEGLAEVFSTFAIDGKKITWGKAIESHVLALRALEPMPLEQLLFLPREYLHGEGDVSELVTGIAYAQSWALVHYLIFGQRDVPKSALMDYVKGLRAAEHHPDEAFKRAFGGTYAEVHKKLVTYLRDGKYYMQTQPLLQLPAQKAEPASGLEVEEALARLRMAGGRHAEAKENIARAIALAPDNPRVYELQGEHAEELEDEAAALAAYHTAIQKGSSDFRPYFEVASRAHRDGGITPEKARGIANGYEKAINLNPRFRESYLGLGGIVGSTPPGNVEDVKFLELGLRLYPEEGMIKLGIATIAKREGNTERAQTLLKEVLTGTDLKSQVIEYAKRLEGEWVGSDISKQVDTLAKDKKYAEAIALIDKQFEQGVDISTGQRLRHIRAQLVISDGMDRARAAADERRYDDAKAILRAVLDSNLPPLMTMSVSRYLADLEKRPAPKKKKEAAAP